MVGRPLTQTLGIKMSLLEKLKALLGKQRAYAGFFKLGSKEQEELTVVENLLGSMNARGDAKYFQPRIAAADPPDCIVQTASGTPVAIEVTELVCEDSVRINARQDRRAIARMDPGVAVMRVWEKDTFIAQITERLTDKDTKKLKGAPYAQYVVALHTDEPLLEREQCLAWLHNHTFGPFQQLGEAYLLFSYMAEKGYEYIKLEVTQQTVPADRRE